MFISIILPAYNAEATIEGCLRSIHNQSYEGEYEVILVDNGSTDLTVKRAIEVGVGQLIVSPDTTVYGARNEAVAASNGELLAFIDSDCIADLNWLTHGLKMLESCDVVSGHILPQESEKSVLYYYDKYVAWAHKGKDGIPVNIAAGNAFVKRSVFDVIGGFDESLRTAGDSIFSTKARASGLVIRHSQASVVYHPVDDFRRRVRGLFREGDGAQLKSFARNVKQTKVQKVWGKTVQLFSQIKLELKGISEARKRNSFGRIMAFRLSVFCLFIKLLSYSAILSSKYFKVLNRRLARR